MPVRSARVPTSLAIPNSASFSLVILFSGLARALSFFIPLEVMFSGIHMMTVPSDANLASHALAEEGSYRFHAFSADDAITLVRPI